MHFHESDHEHERPYLSFEAGRELQIMVSDYMLRMQWAWLGPEKPVHRASDEFAGLRKSDLGERFSRFMAGIFKPFRSPIKGPRDGESYSRDLFESLRGEWPTILGHIERAGTALGWMSGYLTGRLRLPPERVRSMAAADYEKALSRIPPTLFAKYDIDPNEPAELRGLFAADGRGVLRNDSIERAHAAAYAEREGSRWIAVYDENGERAGRPYEVISALFRKQVAESIRNGETLEQMRQRMVFPDILSLLENGTINKDEYEEWTKRHLNRDFWRFAHTETAYAFNHGRLHYMASTAGERPVYARFIRGRQRI